MAKKMENRKSMRWLQVTVMILVIEQYPEEDLQNESSLFEDEDFPEDISSRGVNTKDVVT